LIHYSSTSSSIALLAVILEFLSLEIFAYF
jgi:hypothetical protein